MQQDEVLKLAKEKLRQLDNHLLDVGIVDEQLFKGFIDAEIYNAATSVHWLEGRLSVLKQRIEAGKHIIVFGINHVPEKKIDQMADFQQWVSEYFPSARLQYVKDHEE